MKVLALYHMKGGVGKTAAAVNLSYLAAHSGATTLICDLDPQASATYYFRVRSKLKAKRKIFTFKKRYIEENIKATDFEHLDILPGALSHRHLTETFQKMKHPVRCLQRSLASLKSQYQYVILDCPPGVSLIAENVFYAADCILVPIVPSPLSLHAYQQVRTFYAKHGYDLNKLRTFFSMVERQKKLHQAVMTELTTSHPETLPHAIPYLVDVENMGVHREPVPVSAPRSRATQAYQGLWQSLESILNPTLQETTTGLAAPEAHHTVELQVQSSRTSVSITPETPAPRTVASPAALKPAK